MKVNPTIQVSIRFDPVSGNWFLQETVKLGEFSYSCENISPVFSTLEEAEDAMAHLLEVYDSCLAAQG